jgi:hypothetical protein
MNLGRKGHMTSLRWIIGVFVFTFAPGGISASETKPPEKLIDKGACPFECCTYKTWKTEENTAAYAAPDTKSPVVGTFQAGTEVYGVTGEVHVYPSRFIVKKAHGRYRPADTLWVYTYLGEGFFKVWFRGRMFEEDLRFSPYGGSPGKRCEKSSYCWGELDTELKFTWWVKIGSSEGWMGWSDKPGNFSKKDACG